MSVKTPVEIRISVDIWKVKYRLIISVDRCPLYRLVSSTYLLLLGAHKSGELVHLQEKVSWNGKKRSKKQVSARIFAGAKVASPKKSSLGFVPTPNYPRCKGRFHLRHVPKMNKNLEISKKISGRFRKSGDNFKIRELPDHIGKLDRTGCIMLLFHQLPWRKQLVLDCWNVAILFIIFIFRCHISWAFNIILHFSGDRYVQFNILARCSWKIYIIGPEVEAKAI